MRWTSAHSVRDTAADAVSEALALLEAEHGPDIPDLLFLFTSGYSGEDLQRVNDALVDAWPRAVLVGCTAEGIVGSDEEVEGRPAVCVLAATLPDCQVTAFAADPEQLADMAWARGLLPEPREEPLLIAFPDPFSVDPEALFGGLDAACPGAPVVGGFASQAREPGGNTLFLNGELHTEGLVGLALAGGITADIVVSQGCRPIGDYRVVTQAEGRWVKGLRNQPALQALEELARELEPRDRDLLSEGLYIGRAIDPNRRSFERGDFLITTVLGGDPETGALAIAGEVRPGTTVQFHVRDADAADEDLSSLLSRHEGQDYAAALLFTCNGRGTRMWTEPGHDVTAVQERFGPLPVGGLFAAGEIGPIGGRNFVHGFTASIALLRPKTD